MERAVFDLLACESDLLHVAGELSDALILLLIDDLAGALRHHYAQCIAGGGVFLRSQFFYKTPACRRDVMYWYPQKKKWT